MIKIYLIQARPEIRLLAKIIIQMKIAFFIVLITCLNVSAKVFSQQKLSLDVQNIKLQKALQIIEKRSSYRFVYSPTEGPFNKTVSIKTFEASLDDVMRTLLEGTALSFYVQENNLVTILPKSKTNQDVTISGLVKDTEGIPLPGVTVSVKGVKGMGTSTNNQGKFSLKVPDNSVIVFSAIGFETVEIPAKASMEVILKGASGALDEVVVQAYGTTTKRKTTSSISTLNMENVASLPVQSINDAVAGRIPGVIVQASNGAPGSKSSISIRGGLTPLFVIDGVIRSSNDFSNLNPNDIEDYSVLKDAAATALYGVSAANGVIVVTTKKGKEGVASISYSFNQIFSQPTLFPEKVSSFDQLSALNRLYADEGKGVFVQPADLEKYRNGSDPFNFPNTDWQALTMKNFAPEMRHDISVTAGTKLLTYYAGVSHFDQGSILKTKNNYNKRTTYRLNTVSSFDNVHLKVTAGIDGFIERNAVPYVGYGGVYSHIQNSGTRQIALNEYGLPSTKPDNPVRELHPESGYDRTFAKVMNTNLGLEYSAPFLEGLKFKFNGAYTTYNNVRKIWTYLAPAYGLGSTTPQYAAAPNLDNRQGQGSTLTLQGYVTYNKVFGDHSIDFTGVAERQKDDNSNLTGVRSKYQIIFDQIVAGPTVDASVSGSEGESRRAALVGRLAYSYKSRYSIEGSVRRDGDYIFPPKSQWGTFYAVSGNYIVSEENFMATLKQKHIIDFLKLRGSYGLLGDKIDLVTSEQIAAFQYVSAYALNANAWIVNGNLVQGSSEPSNLPNGTYSWQEIGSRNLALEFGTLNSRLNGTFDYFYTRRKGFVTGDPRFSQTLGTGLPRINFEEAAYRTEGFDFNLNWSSNLRDLTYKIGVNFTRQNSLWERHPTESDAAIRNPYSRTSGNTTQYATIGLHSLGYYTENSQLLSGARFINYASIVAGDLKYQDTNGDGQINGDDNRRIGSSSKPRTNYGITLDLGYKGFYFNAVVQGAGNRDRYIGNAVQGQDLQNPMPYAYQQDYWRPDNTDAIFPRAVTAPTVNASNNFQRSDAWLLQSKYVRLKYLQLGYDFKQGVLKKSPFQQLRLFVSGTNLLTTGKSQDFFIDPESGTDNLNNYEYPIQRTFAIGINAGF